MINIFNKEGSGSDNDKGVSPVIGVILMVAITVILAAVIGTFVLDLAGNQSAPAQASVEFNAQENGLHVQLVDNQNADKVEVRVNGTSEGELTTVGETVTVAVSESDTVTAVGFNNGNETVLRTYTAESSLGYMSGTVSYNPPAEGVTVKALDSSGSVIAQDVTDKQGQFALPKTANSYTVNGYDVSDTALDDNDIELDSSDVAKDGDTVANVLMEQNSSDAYEIDSASDLQAIKTDKDDNYKLVSNIDASHTKDWSSEEVEETLSAGYWDPNIGSFRNNSNDVPSDVKLMTSGGTEISKSAYSINDSGDVVVEDVSQMPDRLTSFEYTATVDRLVSFEPVGTSSNSFNGTLNGNGYEIQNLTVNEPDTTNVGLIGYMGSDSDVNNVNVVDSTITGDAQVGLIGYMSSGSDVNNVNIVDSTITGDGSVGGLVGYNKSGSVTESNTNVTIETKSYLASDGFGGLVGYNDGNITDSYATGSIDIDINAGGLVGDNYGSVSNSYATGNVTGDDAGGLVGNNYGSVSNSYATGNVTGDNVGGLVGNNNEGSVSNSYATGSVTGGEYHSGGFVGDNGSSGSVSYSYWNKSVNSTGVDSKNGEISNLTGLTTSEMQEDTTNTMSALNFDTVWTTGGSNEYPNLQWESS